MQVGNAFTMRPIEPSNSVNDAIKNSDTQSGTPILHARPGTPTASNWIVYIDGADPQSPIKAPNNIDESTDNSNATTTPTRWKVADDPTTAVGQRCCCCPGVTSEIVAFY